MGKITDEDQRLMDEIKADPIAYDLLKAKASWEGMSLFAVLHEYSDPRTWEVYRAELFS